MNPRAKSSPHESAAPARAHGSILAFPRVRLGLAPRSKGFSLIELMIVMSVLGILASMAAPHFLAARRLSAERAVAAALRSMVAEQQLFFLNPAPLPPSATADLTRRYARLHELNAFTGNAFGDVSSVVFIDGRGVRYSMVPLWPTTASLRGSFSIQATEQTPGGFIYEINESGRVVKIR